MEFHKQKGEYEDNCCNLPYLKEWNCL